jgi:tetratricopeptide (TPR) repeat protein
MAKRHDRQKGKAGSNKRRDDSKPSDAGAVAPSKRKLLLFRLLALIAAPTLFLALLELGLRVAGFGHPASFLLPSSHHGRETFVQNNQFGWNFFGPRMARLPFPFSITREKSSGTIRIFVFGESAAKGEPQPAFGLPHMLEAMLSLRHPGTRFEVVNVAMTAINSHAIRRIAHDCARADGDIWVIYMGNNEVVGPFGAGTVFGQQGPALPVIRASLALKSTRTGQLLDRLLSGSAKPAQANGEWRGMGMFLEQQVRADDPRLQAVYSNFTRNLADIIRTGQRGGVGIVVSTVASNLRDCAPFASEHRPDLKPEDRANWDRLFQLGVQAQVASNDVEAARQFEEAARIDSSFAELRFRQGMCAWALGQPGEAREHFQAARDLDTLRFRCDTKLNAITRQTVTNRETERVLFADSERTFAQRSPDEVPGANLFYEHVHMTFAGNYLLARTLAEQIEKLLPARLATAAWPTAQLCAARLAWTDWSLQAAMQDILSRMSAPPFTGQMDHDAQLNDLRHGLQQLTASLRGAGVTGAIALCEAAVAVAPDDPILLAQMSSLKQLTGDLEGAARLAQIVLELEPTDAQAWTRLGFIAAQRQNPAEAAEAFRRAIALDPSDVVSMQNLGQALWLQGRREEAIATYRRAIEFEPNFVVGWLALGQTLEEAGRKTEAETCYQKALACHAYRAADLAALARFCRSRGWAEGASTNYAQALYLNPADAKLWVEAGENQLALGRFPAAKTNFAEAVRLTPDSARTRQLYGSVLGQLGQAAEAEEQLREAVRLAPGDLEARLNLGIAFLAQGRTNEALSSFDGVLQQNPTNALALRYVKALRGARRQ